MLDLYIWGAAFGLPSIDPECLAVIAHLNRAAPESSWRIIPSNDPSVCPANKLPCIHNDGVWVSGYINITAHLSQTLNLTTTTKPPTASQKADITAYTALAASQLAPLLSLSLYVSSANWAATTRPAYTALLPLPLTWTVPPLIRQDACRRAAHLGLAALDSDFDPEGGLSAVGGSEQHLPESFRRHLAAAGMGRKMVREEMTPEQRTAIRLFAVAEDALAGFDELLRDGGGGGGEWLVGDEPTELDFLVFGYLALMKHADVPRPFLRDWIEDKAPRLFDFVDRVRETHLPTTISASPPPPSRGTFLGVARRTLDSCLLNTPGIGEHYAAEVRRRGAEKGAGLAGLDARTVFLTVSLLVAGAAAGYGAWWYRALPRFGARTQLWKAGGASRLSEFGNLGVMLDSALGPRASQPAGRFVETDSEVE